MTLLTENEITAGLAGLPAWTREGEAIVRTLEAPSFLAGIDLVGQVARIAEDADHHPDIDIRWRTLRFALSTHSAGGLTARDLDLAHAIDEAAR